MPHFARFWAKKNFSPNGEKSKANTKRKHHIHSGNTFAFCGAAAQHGRSPFWRVSGLYPRYCSTSKGGCQGGGGGDQTGNRQPQEGQGGLVVCFAPRRKTEPPAYESPLTPGAQRRAEKFFGSFLPRKGHLLILFRGKEL